MKCVDYADLYFLDRVGAVGVLFLFIVYVKLF